MKRYIDENERIWTLEELEKEYSQLKAEGETEAETFKDYIRNCTDKNGTLTEI